MNKYLYILLGIIIAIPSIVWGVNISVPQATSFGQLLRGNANGTYTPVATSTLGILGNPDFTYNTNIGFGVTGSATGTKTHFTAGIHASGTSQVERLGIYDYLAITPTSTPATPSRGSVFYGTTINTQDQTGVIDSTGFERVLFRDLFLQGKNTTGSTITKGQAVYINGATGGFSTFALAEATTTANLEPIGIASANIANNAFGLAYTAGAITGINTSAFTAGDILWVSATPGALTNTEPAFPLRTTKVGTVRISGVGNGSVAVSIRETHREEDGTSFNTYQIGDTLTGTKALTFNGTNDASIQWDSANSLLKLSNLTSNGFVKTGSGDGRLSVDTNTYLTTVDISANTNLAATYPLVLTGDTLSTALSTTTLKQTYGTNQSGELSLATSSDTNIGLNITNTNGAFTFTPTWIGTLANARLTNSTISGIALGNSLENLTAGTGLTAPGTYNGGTARTFSLNTAGLGTNTLVTFDGSNLVSTGTPQLTVGNIVATTTTATSTLPRLSVQTALAFFDKYWTSFTAMMSSISAAFTSQNNTYTATTQDFSAATVVQHKYPSFTYSTSTPWTASTTIALGVARVNETWVNTSCYTSAGTLNAQFYYIQTGSTQVKMNMLPLTTATTSQTFSTNNTVPAGSKRFVDIGTPASSPVYVTCTPDIIQNQ